MTKKLYSIYDRTAGTYTDPQIFINDNTAARIFQIEAVNPDSLINKFPTDFTLCCIGSFDTENGSIDSSETYTVCRGTDFVVKENE